MQVFSSEKQKLKVYVKEKVRYYCVEIEKCEEDAFNLAKKYENQLSVNRNLWDEHEKIHKTVKRIEDNKNKDKERFCKNCFKWYQDKSNFAWSCKRHVGEWNQVSYWCCGNLIRSSPGCVISYHISDESSHIKVVDISKEVCLTCGVIGHPFTKCPKDPNILQNFTDTKCELERVFKVRNKGRMNTEKFIRAFKIEKTQFE
jgi:hypothetical protein